MELYLRQNLKALRLNAKMNQQEFAALFGLGDSTYGNYETGYTKQPDLLVVKRIANHFDLLVDDLLYKKIDLQQLDEQGEKGLKRYGIKAEDQQLMGEPAPEELEFTEHIDAVAKIYKQHIKRLNARIASLERQLKMMKQR